MGRARLMGFWRREFCDMGAARFRGTPVGDGGKSRLEWGSIWESKLLLYLTKHSTGREVEEVGKAGVEAGAGAEVRRFGEGS